VYAGARYIDGNGNWHIINHAYATDEWEHCGNSTLSAHVFSKDGLDWHMLEPNVEPYHHTVSSAVTFFSHFHVVVADPPPPSSRVQFDS
jgi:hypothetical protein